MCRLLMSCFSTHWLLKLCAFIATLSFTYTVNLCMLILIIKANEMYYFSNLF